MITLNKNKRMQWSVLLTALFFLPIAAHAQMSTLVNIPVLSEADGFNGYVNAVYLLCISIAALLAVVKIIIAGVKYMFSDIVTHKSEAKKDIKGALLGLLVILGAVLILSLINENLTRFDIDNVNTLQRAPDQTQPNAVTIAPRENQGPGYRSIPNDDQSPDRIGAFYMSCNGELVTHQEEIRCYEVDPEIERGIREKLATLDDNVIDTAVDQFAFYLSERLIADEQTISDIEAEWSIDGEEVEVLFAIDLNVNLDSHSPVHSQFDASTQAETVCARYQEANPDVIIDYVEPGNNQNYGACLQIN